MNAFALQKESNVADASMEHPVSAIAESDNQRIFKLQKTAFKMRAGAPTYAERIQTLSKLEKALYEHRFDFARAVDEDFGGRSVEETLLLEIFVIIDEIRHTKRHLKKWMKAHWVMPNWQFLPSTTQFIYQPKGVVGVMGAWNYQLLLTLSPMIGALAAGNNVMVRPSELGPKSARLMKEVLGKLYPEEQVAVLLGGVEVSQEFSTLPFDHMIFTGSTRVGKIIMRNAAEHLTPVTLELGGKSPALIDDDYDVLSAARKIMHGKLQNAGQTCVAPDYVLIHSSRKDAFVQEAMRVAKEYYPTLVNNPDYTRIISERHYARLMEIVDEVKRTGGKVDVCNPAGEVCSQQNGVFAPTVVHDCKDGTMALTEEIFGPILPVVSFDSLDEAIAYINDRPRPLALYYFGNRSAAQKKVLNQTISGGVTVNGCIYHLPQNNLPFGGVGDSGMGAYHGLDGFETFSKKKAIFFQSRFSLTKFMRPPYGPLLRFLIGFVLTHLPVIEKIPASARGTPKGLPRG